MRDSRIQLRLLTSLRRTPDFQDSLQATWLKTGLRSILSASRILFRAPENVQESLPVTWLKRFQKVS
jgi:hypothetical protein